MLEEDQGYGPPLLRRARRSEPIVDTTIGEILEKALGIEPGRWTQSDQNRVSVPAKHSAEVKVERKRPKRRKAG